MGCSAPASAHFATSRALASGGGERQAAVDASADRPQLSIDRERVIGQCDDWTEPGSLETKGFVILLKLYNHALGAADPLLPLSPPPYKTHCDPHVPYLALSFVF